VSRRRTSVSGGPCPRPSAERKRKRGAFRGKRRKKSESECLTTKKRGVVSYLDSGTTNSRGSGPRVNRGENLQEKEEQRIGFETGKKKKKIFRGYRRNLIPCGKEKRKKSGTDGDGRGKKKGRWPLKGGRTSRFLRGEGNTAGTAHPIFL